MRIVHLIESLNPAGGGPPVIAASIAAAQAKLGHEVTLLAYDDGAARSATEQLIAETPGFDGVRHVALPREGRLAKLSGRAVRQWLGEHGGETDALHLHQVWEPCLPAAAAWARSRGVPYFVLVNGMLHPWSLAQSRLKKQIALRLVYRKMLNGAAALQLGNADEVAAIERLGLSAKTRVIPNGVWPEDVQPLPAAGTFRAARDLTDRPYLLFLARLHHKKGPDILIDAFRQAVEAGFNWNLIVAGDDYGEREMLSRKIETHGLGERVLLVGPLYHDEKWAALRDADGFCLPSRQEGFPVAVLEAMKAGLPCLISRECNVPEVGETGAGEVLPLDAQHFAQAMCRLADDAARREEQGRNAKQLVNERFVWSAVAGQTVEMYAAAGAA